MTATSYNLSRLQSQQIKPFRLHWFSRLRSTNDHAAHLRKHGELFAPAIVLTGNQSAGRGRNSNTWWSGPGSITTTFVFPIDERLSPHQLPLIAGLAVRNAAAEISGNDRIQLKWPNDLIFHGKKLAGLLCERIHKAYLIGLGLNVSFNNDVPPSLRKKIVSLEEIAGHDLDKTDVLLAVIKHLYPMLARRHTNPFSTILRQYDKHHALLGKRLKISSPNSASGICQGLDSMGRLLVRGGGQLHRIVAGQVEIH